MAQKMSGLSCLAMNAVRQDDTQMNYFKQGFSLICFLWSFVGEESIPDNIQVDVSVIHHAISVIKVNSNDIVQLRYGQVDISVVRCVQGNATYAATSRKQQVLSRHCKYTWAIWQTSASCYF